MELRLDEIKNLVIKEHKYPAFQGKDSDNIYAREVQGFNEALTQQGKRKIGLNREKLKELLIEKHGQYWDDNSDSFRGVIEEIIDAILSHLNELIESVPLCSVCDSNPCQSTCSKQQFPDSVPEVKK